MIRSAGARTLESGPRESSPEFFDDLSDIVFTPIRQCVDAPS